MKKGLTVNFHVYHLTNLTTEMDMIKIKSETPIGLTEFDKDRVCFEVDQKSCSVGQLVNIDGIIAFPEGNTPFSCLGKVAKIQPQDHNKMKVTVELRSYDKEIWSRFTGLLKNRQMSLDKVFNSMKDEE